MKILILKPSALGDVVQALPVLRLLRLHFPKSEIYWWIDANLSPLLENDSDLTGIFTFHRERWSSPLHWNEFFRSIVEMRAKKFDLVIDLQGLARSGIFAWLANGQSTIGVADPREGAPGFYDYAVPRPSFETHAVDWYLSVLQFIGVPIDKPFVWLPSHKVAQQTIEKMAADTSRWIAIVPGARWSNKRWPAEYFVELLARLTAKHADHHFVILGAKGDRELGELLFRNAPRCLDLTAKTSLPEMLEWIRRSEILVTNDTGPMHVAAALGKPIVSIFGPTDPRRTGPYGQVPRALRIELPCSPCMKEVCTYEKPLECLRGISPESVEREIDRRFEEFAQRPP